MYAELNPDDFQLREHHHLWGSHFLTYFAQWKVILIIRWELWMSGDTIQVTRATWHVSQLFNQFKKTRSWVMTHDFSTFTRGNWPHLLFPNQFFLSDSMSLMPVLSIPDFKIEGQNTLKNDLLWKLNVPLLSEYFKNKRLVGRSNPRCMYCDNKSENLSASDQIIILYNVS